MDLVPADVLVLILRHHPLGFVARVCRLVCTYWCAVISKKCAGLFWRRPTYGAFTEDITYLTRYYRTLLADGGWSIDFAWEANQLFVDIPNRRWLELSAEERAFVNITIESDGTGGYYSLHALVALREGIVTIDQCISLGDQIKYRHASAIERCFAALREKLVAFEQLSVLRESGLRYLFDDELYGLEAMREGFITPVVVACFLTPTDVVCCTYKRAFQAMRQGWFPWDCFTNQQISRRDLEKIFSPHTGADLADAIRDGAIAWHEIESLRNLSVDALIVTPLAISAIREGLFTLVDLDAFRSDFHFFEAFDPPYVLSLIRNGYTTISEIVQLDSLDDIEPFLAEKLRKKTKLD